MFSNCKLIVSSFMQANLIINQLGMKIKISIDQRIEGAAKVGAHKTSMLQDYEKGKELELDSLVVSIKEIGNLLSINTPTIDRILYEVEKKISKNN